MKNDDLALVLTEPKKEKRVTRYQVDDWNDVDVKSISEIIMATMVCFLQLYDHLIFKHVMISYSFYLVRFGGGLRNHMLNRIYRYRLDLVLPKP